MTKRSFLISWKNGQGSVSLHSIMSIMVRLLPVAVLKIDPIIVPSFIALVAPIALAPLIALATLIKQAWPAPSYTKQRRCGHRCCLCFYLSNCWCPCSCGVRNRVGALRPSKCVALQRAEIHLRTFVGRTSAKFCHNYV